MPLSVAPLAVIAVATPVVAVGAAAGVTLLDTPDGMLAPTALIALTVKVYAVPLFSPLTTWLNAVLLAWVSVPPAGLETTVYLVIALPPSSSGALNVTVARRSPPIALAINGAPGATTLTPGSYNSKLDSAALLNWPPTTATWPRTNKVAVW